MDHILLHTFRITLNLSCKKHETLTGTKIKNKIAYKIKTGYKLKLLSRETMKLLGSAKKDADKDKDG